MTLIEGRLKAKYPAVDYSVHGRPTDLAGARELARRDKYQFQWWAAWKLGSQTYREDKKGADRGIDGNIYFHNGPYGAGRIIASVKGGENVGVQMVRDLRGVIEREDAEMGIMVTLANPTGPMLSRGGQRGFCSQICARAPAAPSDCVRRRYSSGTHAQAPAVAATRSQTADSAEARTRRPN